MFDDDVLTLAAAVLDGMRERGLKLVTAESCTGGLIAAALTEIAGSSDVLERGFVTYSNEAKAENLGVPEALLRLKGAVSPEVARAMAEGALARSAADVSLAVTGIAGPAGGSEKKPVGLVYIASAVAHGETKVEEHRFAGDRAAVRRETVIAALKLVAVRL